MDRRKRRRHEICDDNFEIQGDDLSLELLASGSDDSDIGLLSSSSESEDESGEDSDSDDPEWRSGNRFAHIDCLRTMSRHVFVRNANLGHCSYVRLIAKVWRHLFSYYVAIVALRSRDRSPRRTHQDDISKSTDSLQLPCE
eukprot:scpid81439/ scgid30355/ 